MKKCDHRRKLTPEQVSRLNRRLRLSQGPDRDIERPYLVCVRDHRRRGVIVDSVDGRAAETVKEWWTR